MLNKMDENHQIYDSDTSPNNHKAPNSPDAIDQGNASDGIDLSTKEHQQPASIASDSPTINGESGFYNPTTPSSTGLKSALTKLSSISGRKKIGVFGGSIVMLVVGVGAFFSFINTFQLVHLGEFFDSKFDGHTKRILNRRAAKHYQIIFDEEGKGYYKKKGVGRITSMYSELNPDSIVSDLKEKGYDINVDKQGKLTINGDKFTGKLGDQRSQISGILDESYPNENFIKRYRRTVTTYKTFGIRRVFFENTKNKINNWELEQIKRIREKVKPTSEADINVANEKDKQAIADEASAQSELLSDPTYNPELDPKKTDVSSLGGKITKEVKGMSPTSLLSNGASKVGSGVGDAIKIDGATQAMCNVKTYMNDIVLGIKAYRYRALLEYALPILIASNQMKNSNRPTSSSETSNTGGAETAKAAINMEQVNGIMKVLNRKPGIGSSGAMQILSGNSKANIKNTDRYSLNVSTGAGGALSTINDKVDEFSGGKNGPGKSYCQLTRNGWYQVGTGVVGVLNGIFGVGEGQTNLVINTAMAVAKSVLIGFIGELAKPIIIDAISGNTINGYESGDKVGDALAAGAAISSSSERYKIGAGEISSTESAQIDSKIAMEKKLDLKNQSIYKKYLDLNNPDSVAYSTAMRIPSSPTVTGKSVISNTVAAINPLKLISKKAKAADELSGSTKVMNQLGITDYGMSDSEVDQLPGVIETEDWMVKNNNMDDYKNWVDKCHKPEGDSMVAEGVATSTAEQDVLEECANADKDSGYRFRAYYLDRAISTGIAFNSKQSDCLNPDDDNWKCAFDDGSEAPKVDNCQTDATSGSTAEPPNDYSKLQIDGKTVNKRTKYMLDEAQKNFGSKFIILQGSYSSGVAASNGTHDGGGVVDLSTSGMSQSKINKQVESLRKAGFAAWFRTCPEFCGNEHIHAVGIGDKEMASGAAAQVKNFFDSSNGLAGNGKDNSPVGLTVTPAWAFKFSKGKNPPADSQCSSSSPGVYKDPLRDVKKKNKERVDPGVDYYLEPGNKVYALGNARVLQADNSWPNGWGFISYKLLDGKAKGLNVYFAENCRPKVKKGDVITADTVICTTYGTGQVETGWAAQGAGVKSSEASREKSCTVYGHEDPFGNNFNEFLKSNNFFEGVHIAPKISCSLPSIYPSWK